MNVNSWSSNSPWKSGRNRESDGYRNIYAYIYLCMNMYIEGESQSVRCLWCPETNARKWIFQSGHKRLFRLCISWFVIPMLTAAFYVHPDKKRGGGDWREAGGGREGPGCLMWVMFIHRRCHHLLTTPSTRVITNRAIWTAADWFQYGSTKSNNEPECQSNQSSRLSLQQPIRSILIKAEEETERQAPSELRWHGPAWQCAVWIPCRTSLSSAWIGGERLHEASIHMIFKEWPIPPGLSFFFFFFESLDTL